jgi:HD superfamily phosphohydrolase
MKIFDFLESKTLAEIKGEIEDFSEYILVPYNNELKKLLELKVDGYGPKDIHDAVWGTIVLNPGEVLIIDSPLLQRLRKINHLGLAGLLFPGADYSRFEHTLGVLEVANKISSKIINDERCKCGNGLPTRQLVRLAAIFHDVGHLIASHASERYFESSAFSRAGLIQTVEDAFRLRADKVDIRLSEIFSVLIVTSAPVIELLKTVWPLTGERNPKTDAEFKNYSGYIAAIILGIPMTWDLLPFHSVIHGPVDADKCDYLARDSQHTGVPVAVDLYRVIQKLKLVQRLPEKLGELWEDTPQSDSSMLLGIALSAVRSIEEIIISRTLMFEKIYYHHKIISAETMFRRALQVLDEAGVPLISDFRYALRMCDDDLLSGKAEIIVPSLIRNISPSTECDVSKVDKAYDLLNNISRRKLLKRACAVSIEFMKSLSNTDVVKIIRDLFEIPRQDLLSEFLISIKQETKEILKYIDNHKHKDEDFENDILTVSIPEIISSDLNMPVEIGGGVKFYRDFFQGELWDNSRKARTTCHYIVSVPDIRYEVFLASEMVLYNKYQVVLEDFSYLLCKLDNGKLLRMKEVLAIKGYYKKSPALIPECLIIKASDHQRIDQLERRWRGYQGPDGNALVDKTSIVTFLRQFFYLAEDTPDTIDGVLILLDKVQVLSRRDISDSLASFLRGLKENDGIDYSSLLIAPFGGLRDSSHHVSYYLNDVEKKLHQKFRFADIYALLQENIEANQTLVFFDDAFWTGKQIICVFQELLGIRIEDRVLYEAHCDPLGASQVARLKKCKIILYCIYGNSKSRGDLEASLGKLGLSIDIRYGREFPQKLFYQEDIFRTEKQRNKIQELFRMIGGQLLKYNKCVNGEYKKGWDAAKVKEFSLGYGDAQQTLVFGWNTPTYTLCALWGKGKLDDGTTWIPLFPRQSKTQLSGP